MIKKETLIELNICEDNEYLDKYVELINNNLDRVGVRGETQNHHIIPKYYYKLNGLPINNDKTNLVVLLYKDHILAHYYLLMCSNNYRYINANDCSIRYLVKKGVVDLSILESKEFADKYKYGRDKTFYLSHTKECNKKIQETLKGRVSPNKGNKKCIEEHKKSKKQLNPKNKRLSDLASQRVGVKNSFYGKTHSDTTKELISNKNGFKVAMMDYETKEVLMVFNSATSAAKYLVEIGAAYSSSANHRILDVCKSNNLKHIAYGYSWKFLEKDN